MIFSSFEFEDSRVMTEINPSPVSLPRLIDEPQQAATRKDGLEGQGFEGTTLVSMELGNSPIDNPYLTHIEHIEVGDKVLSRCEITGEMAYKRVTKVFQYECARFAVIGCQYSWDFDFSPAIITTEEHPFWVVGKGWTAAQDLKSGDEFFTYIGEKTTVKSVRIDTDFEGFVYILEVEDFHTYFAGSAGILVSGIKQV